MASTKTKTDNSAKNAPSQTEDAAAANDAVQAAQVRAAEAEQAAVDAKKTPEEREADKARQEADDARAQAAADEAARNAVPPAMTVAEARMIVPASEPDQAVAVDQMGAGDHMAQKFGNYPENPAPARPEHADPEQATVQLYMIVPDHPQGRRTTMVHPEMVGDYERAGWSRVL